MSHEADEDGVAIGNLRSAIPHVLPDELFTTLAAGRGARIERIVSRGHASPSGFWYEQEESEFVLVTHGHARLEIEGRGELDLRAGDYVHLPARVRHRVTWTSTHEDTIWLAVFFSA
jgi:cupin 2 domain-containing protein